MTNITLTGAQAMYIASLEDDFEFNEEEQELADRWELVQDNIEEIDLDDGYQTEQFVVINQKDYEDKLFAFSLFYDNYQGWTVDGNTSLGPDDLIELYEVEAVPTVKYIRKETPKDESATKHLIPTPDDEVSSTSHEVNN